MQDILLVSCGAIFGANLRFLIYKKLEKFDLAKEFSILTINTIACFLFGLFVSVMSRIRLLDFSYQLVLFISVGFLGSFSTFSTYVYDLFDLFIQFKFLRALKLCLYSLVLGIISIAVGFLLGS